MQDNGLSWGISKCHILAQNGVERVPLWLGGELVNYAESGEYLGVMMDAHGITDAATLERIAKADARLRLLRGAGINRPKLGSARLRLIYGALIEPVWTYGLHVAPFSEAVEIRATRLVDAATAWMSSNLQKHSRRRMRRLLALKDADLQRRTQQVALRSRFEGIRQEERDHGTPEQASASARDAEMAVSVGADSEELGDPEAAQVSRWARVEDSRRRKRRIARATTVEMIAYGGCHRRGMQRVRQIGRLADSRRTRKRPSGT